MANLLEKASIILTPTAYSDGKMHSAKPIVSTNPSVGDFDFARASVATRVNENGLIEEVASGLPRIDYTDGSGSWLLEPASTNLITYSELFSDASWGKNTVIVDPNTNISPDGNLTADSVSGFAGSNIQSLFNNSSFVVSNKTMTFSVYLKGSGTINLAISNYVDDSSNKLVTLTNNWVKYSITKTFNSTVNSTVQVAVNSLTPSTATALDVWGAQLEENSYATSYIKTVGTAQTRVADTATDSGNSTVINSSEGTLYFEGSALANDGTSRNITISGGNSNYVRIYYSTTSSQITYLVVSNGSVVANITANGINQEVIRKIAVSWKLNEFKFYNNGVLVGTDTNGITPIGLNVLKFSEPNASNRFYGKTKSLQVYTTALSDAELTSLTTI